MAESETNSQRYGLIQSVTEFVGTEESEGGAGARFCSKVLMSGLSKAELEGVAGLQWTATGLP
jgi:hypothetical protein